MYQSVTSVHNTVLFVLFVKTNEDLADEIIETESDDVVEAATNAMLEPVEEEEDDDKEYNNDEGLCPLSFL